MLEVESGKEVRQFGTMINSAVFSPDGKFVLSAGNSLGPTVRLWEVDTGKEVQRFDGHEDAVNCVASLIRSLSRLATRVASGSPHAFSVTSR